MKQTPKRQTLTTFADRSVKSLATQFGGWHKLLDPAQPLPVEFIEELKNYIWERELIDYVRSNECVSEAESTTREGRTVVLASDKVLRLPSTSWSSRKRLFWDSMHLPAEWDEAEETMKAHNISRDMVASIVMVALGCHPTT